MYRRSACASRVKVQRKEADGEMERFPWYFVSVDKRAPLSVYGDETKRAWGATEVAPV